MTQRTKQTQGDLIYGIHPLIEVLKAKRRKVISIYTTKPTPKQWKEVELMLPKRPIPIQYVSRDVLHRMAGTADHQGVVAWVQSFPFRSKPFDPKKQPYLLFLDSIQDDRNLGAILRSAYCTGVQGVVMTSKHSASLNAVAIKASAGLAEHLEIQLVSNAVIGAKELKSAGYTLYLAMFDGADATKVEYSEQCCIVIGNEGTGISKELQSYGVSVTLPQKNPDISYNASVAAGILLFTVSLK